ncbi:MAG: hypothetical protein AB8B99_05380 [Phormidesmis sp.]
MQPIYAFSKTAYRSTLTGLVATTLLLTGLLAGCSNHQGHNGSNISEATGGAASVPTTEGIIEGETNRAHNHEGHGADGAHSKHDGVKTNHDVFHSKALEVPAGKPVPALTVRVDDDPVRGWNLYVGTANFNFTPSDVGGESSPTSGHAHLYINEEPIQRIYSNWTHLPELPPGTNQVRVTLNANGHETLTTQGQPIEETVTVEVYDPNAS